LHFWTEELPRTATRKIKRREVTGMLEKLEDSAKKGAADLAPDESRRDAIWLRDIVASVSNRPRTEISLNTRLGDLGFDSLMFVELATAIEGAGGSLTAPERLNEVQDVRELLSVVDRQGSGAVGTTTSARGELDKQDDEIHIPSFVRVIGGKGLDAVQHLFYEKFLRTKFEGQTNIPYHTNFIVAPNHASHLDMGLAKMALGDAGEGMVALAAADYFFDNKYKRAYMDNFTNLVPMERSGSLRQSLRHARSYLDRGYNALIFPEGTRSMTGEMDEFKPVIGYLALAARVGILPIYLHGTYQAMPKGSNMIKGRDVGARIGRFLSIEELEEMTKGMARAEAYRLIASFVHHQVANLRDRTKTPFDFAAVHKQWKAERRALAAERKDAGTGQLVS
jgi:long-chain acyl-CoA synthetase